MNYIRNLKETKPQLTRRAPVSITNYIRNLKETKNYNNRTAIKTKLLHTFGGTLFTVLHGLALDISKAKTVFIKTSSILPAQGKYYSDSFSELTTFTVCFDLFSFSRKMLFLILFFNSLSATKVTQDFAM